MNPDRKRFSGKKVLDEAQSILGQYDLPDRLNTSDEVKKRISKPFLEVDYSLPVVEAAAGSYGISFAATETTELDTELLADYVQHLKEKTDLFEGRVFEMDQWLAIDSLEYRLGELTIDIFSYLPDGFKIIFCPTAEDMTGSVYFDAKTILLTGDIASIGGLVTLLHEVGHVDYKKHEHTDIDASDHTPEKNAFAAKKLHEEQGASLFALRKIWKFLRTHPEIKSDVVWFLRDYAYGSHASNQLFQATKAEITWNAHGGDYDDYNDDYWYKEDGADVIEDPIETEPIAVDISDQIREILATANMPERLRLTKELEWQIADRSDVVATLDWTNLNHAKWIRSFVQRVDVSGVWKIAIRATESQMKEDPNIFTGVIDWIQVSE